MSERTRQCPAVQDLVAFAQGKLGESESDAVVGHLLDCSVCSLRVEQAESDSFVAKVRSAIQGGPPVYPAGLPPGSTPAGNSQTAWPTTQESPAGMPGSALPPDLPPELVEHERYRVVRELGRGGMGVVVLAEERKHPQHRVAIKYIYPHLVGSPESLSRFRREAELALGLNHPHIVVIHEVEQKGASPLLVMEYIEGQRLDEVLSARGRLAVPVACDYVRQAALGLQHAHEKGLVHRDIKPQNLMLAGEVVKVLDLGLAKEVRESVGESGITPPGLVLGTPDYMAPEQIKSAPGAGIRADIYSLGCTLYCLLAGCPPYAKLMDLAEKCRAHVDHSSHPPSLSKQGVKLPSGLSGVINRMLAKDPAERFSTPAEVAEALDPFTIEQKERSMKYLIVGVMMAVLVLGVGVWAYLLANWNSGAKDNPVVKKPKDEAEAAGDKMPKDKPEVAGGKKKPEDKPKVAGESERLTTDAWQAFKQGKVIMQKGKQTETAKPHFDEALRLADLCIDGFLENAKEMQKALEQAKPSLPEEGEVSKDDKQRIFKNWAVNDVSTCLFIRGRSLEYLLRDKSSPKDDAQRKEWIESARKAFQQASELSYGRCWDPDGPWFWCPPKDAVSRLKRLDQDFPK